MIVNAFVLAIKTFNKLMFDTLSPFKLADKSYKVHVVPLSSIQTSLGHLTSPSHSATLENKRSGLRGETISLQVLCAANIRRP